MRLLKLIVGIGIVVCLTPCVTTIIQAASGLVVVPVFSTYQASINDLFVIVYTIENHGDELVEADVCAMVPNGWIDMLATNRIAVEPGSDESIFLTVTVPQSTQAGDYEVSVCLMDEDGLLLAEGCAAVKVRPSRGVEGAIPSKIDVVSGQSIEFPLTLHNRGNVPEQVELDFAAEGNLKVGSIEQHACLAPGQKYQVWLSIECPEGMGAGFYQLGLIVRSLDGLILDKLESSVVVSKDHLDANKVSMTPLVYSLGQYHTTYSKGSQISRFTLQGYGSYRVPLNQTASQRQMSLSEMSYRLSLESSSSGTRIDDAIFIHRSSSSGLEVGLVSSPGKFLSYSGLGALITMPAWRFSPCFVLMSERKTGDLRIGGRLSLFTTPMKVEFACSTVVNESPSIWTELTFLSRVERIKGLSIGGVIAAVHSMETQDYGGRLNVYYSRNPVSIAFETLRYPSGYLGKEQWSIFAAGSLILDRSSYHVSVKGHTLGHNPEQLPAIVRSAEFQTSLLLAENIKLVLTAQTSKREGKDSRDLSKPWNTSLKSLIKRSTTWKGFQLNWSSWITMRSAVFLFADEYGLSLLAEIDKEPRRTLNVRLTDSRHYTELETGLVWTTQINGELGVVADFESILTSYDDGRAVTHKEALQVNAAYRLSESTAVNVVLGLSHQGKNWNWKVEGSVDYAFEFPLFWIRTGGTVHGRVLLFSQSDDSLENVGGYEGMNVFVGDVQEMTNSEGDVVFGMVPAGSHKVRLQGLPAGYIVKVPEAVDVIAGETTCFDVLVYKVARVSGQVIFDENGDQVYTKNKKGVSGVRVLAVNTRTQETSYAFTRSDGMFDITELLPGQYDILIDPEWVPSGFVSGEPISKTLTVNGGDSKYVNLSIVKEEKAIVFATMPTEAHFSWSPKVPHVNQTIVFYDESTWDFSRSIVSYQWDFGDGNTSNEQDPTHVYHVAGDYVVSLTIVDTLGESSKVSSSVSILPSNTK